MGFSKTVSACLPPIHWGGHVARHDLGEADTNLLLLRERRPLTIIFDMGFENL
jgi:hypothetical protein